MAKRRKTGGVPIAGKFTPVLHDELDSPAFRKLAGNSSKLYIYLKRAARNAAHRTGVPERDVQFGFTYSEARTHGFAERTFIRSLKELWALGFIDVVERGGLRGAGRTNSQYRLCGYWKTYGVKDGWANRADHELNPFENRSEPGEAA